MAHVAFIMNKGMLAFLLYFLSRLLLLSHFKKKEFKEFKNLNTEAGWFKCGIGEAIIARLRQQTRNGRGGGLRSNLFSSYNPVLSSLPKLLSTHSCLRVSALLSPGAWDKNRWRPIMRSLCAFEMLSTSQTFLNLLLHDSPWLHYEHKSQLPPS